MDTQKEVDSENLLEPRVQYVRKKKIGGKLALLALLTLFSLLVIGPFVSHLSFWNEAQKTNEKINMVSKNLTQMRSLSRQGRALRLGTEQVCSVNNCFANLKFTEADIQRKLDSIVGQLLFKDHFKWSSSLKKARTVFTACLENSSDKTLAAIYERLMDIGSFMNQTVHSSAKPRQVFTDIVLKFWQFFGVEILFQLRTADTFTKEDPERQTLIYLDQKQSPAFDEHLLRLSKLGEQLTDRKLHSDLSQFVAYSDHSYTTSYKYDNDPLNWQILTVDEANRRWPFFDFVHYFRQLDFPRNNYKDGEELKFVVTSPAYLDNLNGSFADDQTTGATNFLYYLGFFTVLSEYASHLPAKQNEKPIQSDHDARLASCVAEIRQHLPLIVSRIFVDGLDESDLELRIQPDMTVYQVFAQVWMRTNDFLEPHLSPDILNELNRHLLPTKFFGEDHGYLEDAEQFDLAHRRFRLKDNSSFVKMLVELRRFKRLRSILCLSKPDNSKCDSYYSQVSSAIPHITYLPREHTIILPVGLMLLLQEVYDEQAEKLDHYSRFEKMITTLKCLLRQAFRQRMTRSALYWNEYGMLLEKERLQKILNLPKVFKCDTDPSTKAAAMALPEQFRGFPTRLLNTDS